MSLHRDVTDQADKLDEEYEVFEAMLPDRWSSERPTEDQVMLALSQAKRVRREANAMVRCLAKLRDHLQA